MTTDCLSRCARREPLTSHGSAFEGKVNARRPLTVLDRRRGVAVRYRPPGANHLLSLIGKPALAHAEVCVGFDVVGMV